MPRIRSRFDARSGLIALGLSTLGLTACAGRSAARFPWTPSPTVADSVSTEVVAEGVRLHRLVWTRQPWRAYVLDVDLHACVSVRAVKGSAAAVGRQTVSALMLGLRGEQQPIAAVNADFFLFAPPGVPVGSHVENGRLLSGPIARPVFGLDASAHPFIGRYAVTGTVTSARGRIAVRRWNRPDNANAGIVDARWGVALDSTITGRVWRLVPLTPVAVAPAAAAPAAEANGRVSDVGRFVADTLPAHSVRMARGDTLLLVGAGAADVALRVGDTVFVQQTRNPGNLQQVVGGQPLLLQDSVVAGAVDSSGNEGFRGPNPRTALGIGSNGRRLLLVVIDGRQPAHSTGMSLRETANVLRSLGARDAINLDGGGSSAMVLRDSASTAGYRFANKPSDAAGERAVANALAVIRGCNR